MISSWAFVIFFSITIGAFIYYLVRAIRLEDKIDIARNICFIIISFCGWLISFVQLFGGI